MPFRLRTVIISLTQRDAFMATRRYKYPIFVEDFLTKKGLTALHIASSSAARPRSATSLYGTRR